MARKNNALVEANERANIARQALRELNAMEMEYTEDKAGIVWARYLLNAQGGNKYISVILYATPKGWDLFSPVAMSNETQATIDALRALRDSL